jgi:hypothetical protein
MTVSQFDKPILRNLQAELKNELAAFCKRHGLKVEFNGGRFDSLMWRPKMEIKIVSQGGVDLSGKQSFENNAQFVGLQASDFGREIVLRGTRYKLVDINLRKRKFPVIVENVNNQADRRLCTVEGIRDQLRKPTQKVFGANPVKPLSKEMREQFLSLAAQLSPENLTCDGELPAAQVRARAAALRLKWAALEQQVGRQVTESEVWVSH